MTFNLDQRYAASVSLKMGVTLDQLVENVSITYNFRIIPILIQYEAQDSISFPLDCVNESRIGAFVEEKILQCVETYLRVQQEPHYQRDNMVVDPVCGMTINRLDAAAF